MRLQGIVFDKDGTLFDFNATWGAWTRGMLARECGDGPQLSQLAEVLGYDLDTAQFLPGSIVVAATVDEIAQRFVSVLPHLERGALIARMNDLAAEVTQVPVCDLVVLMSCLSDYSLGIATNDAEQPARVHLTRAGIIDHFDLILGSDSGYGGKPATGQLDQFCAMTGHDPQACLMVGDSLHDLKAGAAAGMIPVGVLTGPASYGELAPHARVVLPSIADLPDWIAANI